MSYIFPVNGKYTITSPFGSRVAPTAGASSNHNGIDIGVPIGTSVLAAGSGTVIKSGFTAARGNYVVVDHGSGATSTYQHLSNTFKKIGDVVRQGQVIAESGNSGISTGPHLHFEISKNGVAVNPLMADLKSGGAEQITSSFNSESVLNFLKSNWWIVAGGLVLVAVLK